MQLTRASTGLAVASLGVVVLMILAGPLFAQSGLPNRIPQPPPYNTQETQFYPHPFEADWTGVNDPGTC